MNDILTKEQRSNLEKEIDSRWDEVLRMKGLKASVFISDNIKGLLRKEYIRVISEIIFIKKAKIIHGDRYNYDKFVYKGATIKSVVTCPEHGDFLVTPNNHLNHKRGCPKCFGQGFSTEEWIQRFRSVHGDKYNYDRFVFNGNKIKSIVTCPKHGEFLVTPNNHLNRKGCPKCAGKGLSTKEWIERFREVHGDKYNYDRFVYKGAMVKSIVTCPDHGDFLITPVNHLRGSGCPKCKQPKGEIQIENYLKENNIKYETQKKFDGCKHKRSLPFDFYLPDYDLLIEFQGIQHYKPIDYFGGKEGLKYTIINDQIKRDFCKKTENPNLLEIKYTEINDINEILEEHLKL